MVYWKTVDLLLPGAQSLYKGEISVLDTLVLLSITFINFSLQANGSNCAYHGSSCLFRPRFQFDQIFDLPGDWPRCHARVYFHIGSFSTTDTDT